MKKIFSFVSFFWQKFKLLLDFSNKKDLSCLSTDATVELRKLGNSCALTALSRVKPKLSYDDISDAFYNCCDQWPSSGVKHNEFNVALRYLNIFDNFIYADNSQSNLRFSDYSRKKGVYILLIPGHYTVLYNGKIYDSYGYGNLSKSTKVYCSWLLSTGK
ncbi:hypothetical protein MS2017_1356 [Bathymodiolus thermophilus thioautotrophic gill symbiont]|uniref:Uncharacterized protein n=1 Tax=Bathymodiolus thermophilus thioautotrophic gill symbiont TaxID=2360 RepID=A0A3G3IN92_9GAMM|nr:hypothetical protein [Bathymodiolus thermophilus thioautotrophic gill symbiont]AYQ57044.1 hypothetical protein MS2017_1356 [Bathymodiolus thermophilus thioautotrophic gill symbiont]